MTSKNEKDCLNYIQQRYYPTLSRLTLNFKRPVQKFVKQMVYGIISSRSSIVQRVAKEQKEKISLKKTCDRLYRNLKRSPLYSRLMTNHLLLNSRSIKRYSPIFIDLSDISKETASKMKGLSQVWDGSEGEWNKGYFTLQASTCDLDKRKKLQLLYSELFSIKEECTSENEKIMQLLREIAVISGNKGIIVGDRGLDRIRLLNYMLENKMKFIIRGKKRNLIYRGKSSSYYEISKDMDLRYKVVSKQRKFRVGVTRVGIKLPNPPSRKYARKRKRYFYFVAAKEELKNGEKGYIYYLCNIKDEVSEQKLAKMAVNYYGMRWSIEEVHRQIKEDLEWESMQLLTYESLKNMNALVWLAASFIYNEVGKMVNYLVKKLPGRMLYRNKVKELFKNLAYRLTDVVSYLFRLFAVRPRKKYGGYYQKYNKKRQQLTMESIL